MINNPKNTNKAPTRKQFRAMARTAKRTQHPVDWHNLGCCYHYGWGTYPNPTEAAACYAKAEATGFIPAATNLGLLHLHGQGVPQDTFKGLALLKKAADSGEVTAMTVLSQAFLLGWFPELDGNTEIGVQWLIKAAEAGNPVAMYNLGVARAEGAYGFDQDIEAAKYWLLKAHEAGHDMAAQTLLELICIFA